MKFRVERDVLAESVAWAARSLPSRPSVPILAGLLVEAEDGQITLSGFDYETSVRVTVPVYPYVSVRAHWGSPNAYRYTWHRYPTYHRSYRAHDYGYRSHNYVYRNRDYGSRSHGNSYRSHDYGSRNRGSSRWGESRSHGSRSHSASPGGQHSRGRGNGRH